MTVTFIFLHRNFPEQIENNIHDAGDHLFHRRRKILAEFVDAFGRDPDDDHVLR